MQDILHSTSPLSPDNKGFSLYVSQLINVLPGKQNGCHLRRKIDKLKISMDGILMGHSYIQIYFICSCDIHIKETGEISDETKDREFHEAKL